MRPVMLLLFLTVTFSSQQTLEAQPSSTSCDGSLWKYVYKPQRLKKLHPSCITVTGTVGKSTEEKYGDLQVQLKLDPKAEFMNLLNNRNRKTQNGTLVLVFVCAHKGTQPKAPASCEKFTRKVQIPDEGTRVMVTGDYVEDGEPKHGWTEIHPVTSILPIL
jgi:hypothetical protein